MKAWKAAVGNDPEVYKRYNNGYHFIIEKILSRVAEGISVEDCCDIQMPSPYELDHLQIPEVVWIPPLEQFVLYDEYFHQNGEPEKSQIHFAPGGVKLVKVKSDAPWTRETRIVQQARKKQCVVSSGAELEQEFIDDRMQAMADDFLKGERLDTAGEVQSPPARARSSSGQRTKVEPVPSPPVKQEPTSFPFRVPVTAEAATPVTVNIPKVPSPVRGEEAG